MDYEADNMNNWFLPTDSPEEIAEFLGKPIDKFYCSFCHATRECISCSHNRRMEEGQGDE